MEKVQESLGKMGEFVTSLRREYVNWIIKNPGHASDTESGIKLVSYLLHGRLKQTSTILPELIYCSANILSFWHDRLIQSHRQGLEKSSVPNGNGNGHSNGHGHVATGINGHLRGGVSTSIAGAEDGPSQSAELHLKQREARDRNIQRIRTALTIIDYLEVFLEVSARQLWGDFGRWVTIIMIQSVKTGLRAALLFHFKVGLIGSSTLYQRRYSRRALTSYQPNVTFVLKHSGRTVRKVHSAPPVRSRDWTGPVSMDSVSILPQELSGCRKIAEVMHLLRPMAHLACMGMWGTKSWKPWLISFAVDIASLRLHSRSNPNLKREEKIELTRRTYALCYYLMRSPFYDTCTKKRLLGTLIMFSERIPLLGNICGILAQAIPEWQNTYSYMWTDY